jgi:hypothetical protein
VAALAADFGTRGCGTCEDVIGLIQALESRIADLEYKLGKVSRVDNDIYITGANLHIRNGTGSTDETAPNGLGNLIVGYNEEHPDGNVRTGSHNVVVGWEHNYPGYAGMVVGRYNTISSRCSSVIGGYANTANGWYGSVLGGWHNTSIGTGSTIAGGRSNEAVGSFSLAAGGGGELLSAGNMAYAHYSAILGGTKNVTGDPISKDFTLGEASTVSGGSENETTGKNSSISGGQNNNAIGDYSSITGGGDPDPLYGNTASGPYSTILGGRENEASGKGAAVSGGGINTASGDYSSVSGGSRNSATGPDSAVSGGSQRSVSGTHDWRAGSCYFCDN